MRGMRIHTAYRYWTILNRKPCRTLTSCKALGTHGRAAGLLAKGKWVNPSDGNGCLPVREQLCDGGAYAVLGRHAGPRAGHGAQGRLQVVAGRDLGAEQRVRKAQGAGWVGR